MTPEPFQRFTHTSGIGFFLETVKTVIADGRSAYPKLKLGENERVAPLSRQKVKLHAAKAGGVLIIFIAVKQS